MYVGSDLEGAKLDGPENCNFLMNVTTGRMTRTLVQQYYDLNKSEMREINKNSAVCIPKKLYISC